MEKEILKELKRECNLYEKILFSFNKKFIVKIYHLIRYRIVNNFRNN